MKLLALRLAIALTPAAAIAAGPIASSNFAGAEDPLFENGAWAPLTSMSPGGGRFRKNNAAFPNRFAPDHAGARSTAVIPIDHYSEIVVAHLGTLPASNNVGPTVRVQPYGPTIDSHYVWWAGPASGVNSLYRIDANGSSYTSSQVLPTSPVTDGDRLRLIARGPVVYGIKNGMREFIYNTGPEATKLYGGTAGILAFVGGPALTDASIASWSAGAAPASSNVWTSSNFAGVENPLDEGDRWYPLPGYGGFRKAGGLAIGLSSGHNLSGVWSITPPAVQYSEVTLGTVASGGGGPMVRIDRFNAGQTGWLLFLWADNPSGSGIYKVNPGGGFTLLRPFTPIILPGDKWRLTANGNILEVSRNGVSQFTFVTDGSYSNGDVGIEALSPAFTFSAWEGGGTNGPAPTIASFSPTSGPAGTSVTITGTIFTGATEVWFNGRNATFTVTSDTVIQATVPAAASTGPITVSTPKGGAVSDSLFTVTGPPRISTFDPAYSPVGTAVRILGERFTGATAVAFNGTSATFTVISDGAIQTSVPAGATTGPVSVTTPEGTGTSASAFYVTDPPPTITSFAPTSGRVGTSVTINGTSFTGVTAVTFTGSTYSGVSASFTVISNTAIQTTVPSGAVTGPLTVGAPYGTTNSSIAFTVDGTPTITGFAPTRAPVGTSVTIGGTNFTGATAVAFNGVNASFTVMTDTSIQAAVPAGATRGPLTVTTPAGTAMSPGAFQVAGPPRIEFFTRTGSVGSRVRIDGIDFTGATSLTFNGVSASFTVVSDAQIDATVPAGATTGPISVTTPLGTDTSRSNFTVFANFLVTLSGNGKGNVYSRSTPFNPLVTVYEIGCSPYCTNNYALGTVVTLTATPATGSDFTGWTGCDTVSGATCTVTVGGNRTVDASFTLQRFPLTVQKTSTAGVGNGTVSSTSNPASPNQIDCGASCSVLFNYETVVTLTASPSLPSIFNGWTGCDAVSGTTCTVTVRAARSVTANFLP